MASSRVVGAGVAAAGAGVTVAGAVALLFGIKLTLATTLPFCVVVPVLKISSGLKDPNHLLASSIVEKTCSSAGFIRSGSAGAGVTVAGAGVTAAEAARCSLRLTNSLRAFCKAASIGGTVSGLRVLAASST